MHCHDEIVIEHQAIAKQQIEEFMLDLPAWAADRGIPIAVEAWVGPRYRK
jgi:hypothetical protein